MDKQQLYEIHGAESMLKFFLHAHKTELYDYSFLKTMLEKGLLILSTL